MNLGNLIFYIKNRDFENFKTEFQKQVYSQKDKQELLISILDENYNHKNFNFFKKVFDTIIESKIDLNFNIENDYAENILSLVVLNAPHIEVFDYFIEKGAKLNFYNKTNDDEKQTCLDFAEMKFYEDVSDSELNYFTDIDPNFATILNDKICIDRSDYSELLKKSKLLKDIYDTYKIINHIIAIGGKRYSEISKLQNK